MAEDSEFGLVGGNTPRELDPVVLDLDGPGDVSVAVLELSSLVEVASAISTQC